jgi:glyoxylase-like metal-dependent hydrolase (beta-lactamase superfamily II)
MVEASDVLDSHRYLEAARKIAASYTDDIRSGTLMGAPEDIGLCPSSEDTYNALISAIALWQATNEKQWLELARLSADWLLTYRWTYDVRFPAGTPLQKRHFRTLGGDLASPCNNHLHMYGLICQQELFELSRALEDPWYADRALDHLACFVGEVATRNGQFGGAERKGMASEQWYTVDWSREGRAGQMAPVSHAWCLGLLILAIEEWADYSLSPIALPRLDADSGQRLRGDARIRASWRVRQAAHGLQVKPNPPSRRRSIHEQVQSPVRVDSPHVVRLLPGFYQVGGGYLSHSRDAASYLLVDEKSGDSLMIDCGSHAGLAAVRANISAVADINQVKLVIGTHCHWDHVEAFGHLREEIDALFAVHALDARAVRTGDPDLTCAGFLYNEVFHPFPVDITLSGGEQFYIGEYDLEIIHLPGHAPGCIGVMMHYKRTDQTILVPGDSVQGAFAPKIKSNLKHWKHSVRTLMARNIDFMVPNHLPPGSQTSLLVDVPHRLAKIYNQLDTDFYNFADPQRA